MQILHINSLTDLKKHNKRYKFDSGDFHCIYFGSTSKINFDIFEKLKLNVLVTDDIYIDKVKFKSDYVQFIGNLSTCFTSKMWWATQTAAKFRNQIPFILYKLKIVSEILNKYSFEKLIVIDESYLFNRALFFFFKKKSIEFTSSISQARAIYRNFKSFLLFLGSINYSFLKIFYRILLAKYFFINKIKQKNTVRPIIVIKTFAYENSFDEKGQFIDKFFGDLPEYLNKNGYSKVSLVSCLGHYNSILQKIAKDDINAVLPFELFIKTKSLVAEFFKLILLKLEVTKRIFFNDIDVTEFLNFYLKYNKKNEISLEHALHYHGMLNFLKHSNIKSFIFTYENIPWEPMCLLALQEISPNTKTIGYQHSNVPEFGTNYFLSENELQKRPMPNYIYTNGSVTKNIIEKNSFDKHPIIESTCALRYNYLRNGIHKSRKKDKTILVVLEGVPDVYHLVNYILNELSHYNNYEIIFRPHPILPMAKIDKHIQIDYSKLKNVYISDGDLISKDFEKVSVVIYRESTIALEAVVFGLPVICFHSHPVISFDPLFELYDFKWNVDESIKIEPLLNQIFEMDDGSFFKAKQKANLYIEDYFHKCTNEKMSMFTKV